MFKAGYTTYDFEAWFNSVTESALLSSLESNSRLLSAFNWSFAPLGTIRYWSDLQGRSSILEADRENIRILISLYQKYKVNRSLTWPELIAGLSIPQDEVIMSETAETPNEAAELIFHRSFDIREWVRDVNINALKRSINEVHKIDDAMIWENAPFPHNDSRNPYWRRYKNSEMDAEEKVNAHRYIRAMIFIYKQHNAGKTFEQIQEMLKCSEDEWNDYGRVFLNININKKPLGVFTKKSKATEEGKKDFLFWKTIELKMEDQDAA